MSNRADETRYEKIGLRFIAALDDGDLETLASLWEKAVEDAELGRLFCDLTDAVYDDELPESRSAGDILREPVHRFSTLVTREAVAGMQLQVLAEKLSDGSLSPFIMHLVHAEHLSKKEKQALRRLLREQ